MVDIFKTFSLEHFELDLFRLKVYQCRFSDDRIQANNNSRS
jgi:hypothetical protein